MTSLRTDLVMSLDDLTTADAARAGRKAAVLGELRQAGFPVPGGVVLAVEALQQALAAAGLDGDSAPEQVEAAQLPTGIAEALTAAADAFGPVPLAVRSSGVDEDLSGASYAGQYETVLGVAAADLPAAVRRCWASGFAHHVAAYRSALTAPPGPAMAVLVQPLVPAEAAGVAFSADPVTGDRDTVVVNAVRGPGDRLVNGTASPDEWEVRGSTATRRRTPEDAIDAGAALAVAELTRRVEAQLGAPQDVEWALAGGELYLLQSRPVTT
jgi:phosphoenolpyruvate synthase/pyruvate phosphate dikinase